MTKHRGLLALIISGLVISCTIVLLFCWNFNRFSVVKSVKDITVKAAQIIKEYRRIAKASSQDFIRPFERAQLDLIESGSSYLQVDLDKKIISYINPGSD